MVGQTRSSNPKYEQSRVPAVGPAVVCHRCGASVSIPSDLRDLRITQIAAGLTCNLGFFAMLAARSYGVFTLDALWAVVYIIGVGGYALILSKALNVKLKHFELQLPLGGKIEGGAQTTDES